MKRRFTAVIVTATLLAAGLIAAAPGAPAQAAGPAGSAGSAVAVPEFCREAQRFTFTPVQYFYPSDCYVTPNAVLVMTFDGLELHQADRVCRTSPPGGNTYAVFRSDGLFVLDAFDDHVVWRTPPMRDVFARLILRGGDGTLLVRNLIGQDIWHFC